jgi:hypothetical protein
LLATIVLGLTVCTWLVLAAPALGVYTRCPPARDG